MIWYTWKLSIDTDVVSNLSVGAIAGIVIGALCLCLFCIFLVIMIPVCICCCLGVGIGAAANSGRRYDAIWGFGVRVCVFNS